METETAAWPIQVGGIYEPTQRVTPWFRGVRVTAIDGDTIFYILRSEKFDGTIAEHTPNEAPARLFRALYLPEDQSPIPALVEALILARNLLKSLQPDCDCVTCRKIAAALELAGA